MRLLIRTMTLTIFMVFVIQPSAEAEVVSGSYWQKLPDALRTHNEQIWYNVAYWNDVVRWNEAYQQALVDAAKQKTPKTQQQPKVTSDVVSQSGDKFDRLANCESTMRQDAVSPDGQFLSYFQWLPETWYSVGGTGDPRNASYEEQKEKAKILAARSGGGTQWPVCWYRK